jgi:hypothetical protein
VVDHRGLERDAKTLFGPLPQIQKRLRKVNAGPLRSSDYCVNEISPSELVRQQWGSPNL